MSDSIFKTAITICQVPEAAGCVSETNELGGRLTVPAILGSMKRNWSEGNRWEAALDQFAAVLHRLGDAVRFIDARVIGNVLLLAEVIEIFARVKNIGHVEGLLENN